VSFCTCILNTATGGNPTAVHNKSKIYYYYACINTEHVSERKTFGPKEEKIRIIWKRNYIIRSTIFCALHLTLLG
jgi:hypothetical protein